MKTADPHVEVPFVSLRRLLDSHVNFQVWKVGKAAKVGREHSGSDNGQAKAGTNRDEEDLEDALNRPFGDDGDPSAGDEDPREIISSTVGKKQLPSLDLSGAGLPDHTGTTTTAGVPPSHDDSSPTSPFSRQNKKLAEGKFELRKLGMFKAHQVTSFVFNFVEKLPEEVLLSKDYVEEDASLVCKVSWGWMGDGDGPPGEGEANSKEREAELQKRRDRAELVRQKQEALRKRGAAPRAGVTAPKMGQRSSSAASLRGPSGHAEKEEEGRILYFFNIKLTICPRTNLTNSRWRWSRSVFFPSNDLNELTSSPGAARPPKTSLFARNEMRRKKREQLAKEKSEKDKDESLRVLRKGMIRLRMDLRDLNKKRATQSAINLIRVGTQQGDVSGDLLERGVQCGGGLLEEADGGKEEEEVLAGAQCSGKGGTGGASLRTKDTMWTAGGTSTKNSLGSTNPPKSTGSIGIDWAYRASEIAHPGAVRRPWSGGMVGSVDLNPPVPVLNGGRTQQALLGGGEAGRSFADAIRSLGAERLITDAAKPDFSRWKPGGGMVSRGV